jgi:hypothetical protein
VPPLPPVGRAVSGTCRRFSWKPVRRRTRVQRSAVQCGLTTRPSWLVRERMVRANEKAMRGRHHHTARSLPAVVHTLFIRISRALYDVILPATGCRELQDSGVPSSMHLWLGWLQLVLCFARLLFGVKTKLKWCSY